MKMETLFFTFNQNNSGGRFEVDLEKGISHYVIIEAVNAKQANSKAGDIGIYFEGCEGGLDCSCCGDRWYSLDDDDGKKEPSIYGTNVYEYKNSFWSSTACIHRINKPIETIELPCK